MEKLSVPLLPVILLLLVISCSDWNIQGPLIPTGGIEISKIGSLHLADSIYSLLYADGFILAEGRNDFHRIDITAPSLPTEVNTFPRFYYNDLSFNGSKFFFQESRFDSFLLIYDFDSGYTLPDTIHLGARIRDIESNGSHLFVAVGYGFHVVNLVTYSITFSFSDFYYYSTKVYLDAKSIYLTGGDSIFVFSIDNLPDHPMFIDKNEFSSYYLQAIYNSFLYYHIPGDTSQLQFRNVFTNESYKVMLPRSSIIDLSLTDDFAFFTAHIPDSVSLFAINSPNTDHPCILLKENLEYGYGGFHYRYPIVLHNDYLYLCRGDSLSIYSIKRYKHIWED